MERSYTIPEVIQLTGKSESTIKRVVRELRDNPGLPERSYLLPTHEEYEQYRRENTPYVWRLSEHLLRQRFGMKDDVHARQGSAAKKSEATGRNPSDQPDWRELVDALRESNETYKRQLDVKDAQLNSIIKLAVTHANSLSDQLHAASVEMQRMNTQLQLGYAGLTTAGKGSKATSPAVSKGEGSDSPKKGTAVAKVKAKQPPKKVKKQGLLTRIFR